jgi:hypothetical protein
MTNKLTLLTLVLTRIAWFSLVYRNEAYDRFLFRIKDILLNRNNWLRLVDSYL